jgi:hypothetical protein
MFFFRRGFPVSRRNLPRKERLMQQAISLNSQNRYEIKINGQLDDAWLSWCSEAKVHTEVSADAGPVTTLSDVVMDQSGLVGLIRRLHGVGIVLISIRLEAP